MKKVYDKLVRDRIPEIVRGSGAEPKTRIAKDDAEYIRYLRKKVGEESEEIVLEEDVDELKKEIADVEEVLDALARALGVSREEIQAIRMAKNEKRGAFLRRIILEEVEDKG